MEMTTTLKSSLWVLRKNKKILYGVNITIVKIIMW